jgi:hypothetical protein
MRRRVDGETVHMVRRVAGGPLILNAGHRRFSVTISGSLRRHKDQIDKDRDSFSQRGAKVLSPAPGPKDSTYRGFTKLAGDPSDVPRVTEGRHLDAIDKSDLLWVVVPDGKIGVSTALEIGYAHARYVPMFSKGPIDDPTVETMVTAVSSPEQAISATSPSLRAESTTVLLDPPVAIEEIRQGLAELEQLLQIGCGRLTAGESQLATQTSRRIKAMLETLGNLAR